ncbi:uncharacterized protein LOC120211013 [Hibiscus syriacus]|uniref:uncharacterized protein LOC120211013 n=1 Tax=Hibiscus syriacus TaxID=106335 RepID=UPI00192166D6|nr:uncharacterized protein LOC120211013 [Hibiscus syriacus]
MRGGVFERLDCIVANDNWIKLAPHYSVKHLPRIKSDHRRILLQTMGDQRPFYPRPFRFLAGWTKQPHFNKEVYGQIPMEKRKLKQQLAVVQASMDRSGSVNLIDKELDIRTKLEEVLDNDEILWRQKSRSDWIIDGDRNTKFFHSQALNRRKVNRIQALKLSNDKWCYDENTLSTKAISFYESLYEDDGGRLGKFPIRNSFPRLSQEEVELLTA